MAVVLCPCSLSSALVEDLHLTLCLNVLLFAALLAWFWKADTITAAHSTAAHAVYYPLLH
jgi:hypothetical protein